MKLFFFLMCLSIVGCQTTKSEKQFTENEKIRLIKSLKRDDINGQINLFFRSLDIRDYVKAREIVGDKILVDLGAGEKEKSGDEFIEMMKVYHKDLDGTLHSLTNNSSYLQETSSQLKITAITTHYKKTKSGKNLRNQYGVYEVELMQPTNEKEFWNWKISKFKYVNRFTDGNVNLK